MAIFHKLNNIGYTNILQFGVLELGEHTWEMVFQCEKIRYLGWYNFTAWKNEHSTPFIAQCLLNIRMANILVTFRYFSLTFFNFSNVVIQNHLNAWEVIIAGHV